MMEEFYLFQKCASLHLHKSEALIYLNVQAEYGSECVEGYHNTICTQDPIQISQESAHTTGLL